jgi:hypothetical protein
MKTDAVGWLASELRAQLTTALVQFFFERALNELARSNPSDVMLR